MVTHQPPSPPNGRPKVLSTWWYAALIIGVCVVMALIGALAKNYGRELDAENGVVMAMAIGFVIVCVIGVALPRLVGNQTVPIISGLFVGMTAAAVADAAGLNDTETWRSVARYAIFFGVYFVWVLVVVPLVVRRPSAPSNSDSATA